MRLKTRDQNERLLGASTTYKLNSVGRIHIRQHCYLFTFFHREIKFERIKYRRSRDSMHPLANLLICRLKVVKERDIFFFFYIVLYVIQAL